MGRGLRLTACAVRVAAVAVAMSIVSCAAVVSFDDYATPVVPAGWVTVRVTTADGAPMTDADVVFHDEAGSVVDVKRTDGDGRATGTRPTTQVTVAFSAADGTLIMTTFRGVEPGDELDVAAPAPASGPAQSPATRVTVHVPAYGNATYDFQISGRPEGELAGDGSGAIAFVVNVFAEDLDAQGTFALVAHARAPSVGDDHYIVSAHVPLDPRPLSQYLDLKGPWLDPQNVYVSVIPPDDAQHFTQTLGVQALAGEHIVFSGPSFAIPPGLADDVIVEGSASMPTAMVDLAWSVVERAPVATALTIDLSSLPALSANVDATDPKRPVVTWSTADDGIVGARAQLRSGGPDQAVIWTFVLPPQQRKLRAPELPADLTARLPAAWRGPGTYDVPRVELEVADGDAVRSFTEYKRLGLWSSPRVPHRGRLRRTRYRAEF